jgi:hypothetical protein
LGGPGRRTPGHAARLANQHCSYVTHIGRLGRSVTAWLALSRPGYVAPSKAARQPERLELTDVALEVVCRTLTDWANTDAATTL